MGFWYLRCGFCPSRQREWQLEKLESIWLGVVVSCFDFNRNVYR